MKSLRVRFAIGFSILFTVFLAIALLIVYFSSADFRKEEFYKRLKDRSLTTFKLLIEVEQIDLDLLKVIDRNTLNTLYNEKIIIFEGEKVIYASIDDKKIDSLFDVTHSRDENSPMKHRRRYNIICQSSAFPNLRASREIIAANALRGAYKDLRFAVHFDN